MSDVTLEELASLAKRRGFIYQGSEIYGGLSGTWDYGPLGVALKRNIMNLWWKMFVDERDDMFGVDAAILMNQKVWQASGHVDTFADPLVECLRCGTKFRVDQIINEAKFKDFIEGFNKLLDEAIIVAKKEGDKYQSIVQFLDGVPSSDNAFKKLTEDLSKFKQQIDVIQELHNRSLMAKKYVGPVTQTFLNDYTKCSVCGAHSWTLPGLFNMMFETSVGVNFSRVQENIDVDKEGNKNPVFPSFGPLFKEKFYDTDSASYLRPETAQGIFTNYKNVVDSFYPDLPFGLAQQGKAFRNEISPRDFVFRSREFEQMEIEYFVHPDKWEEAFEHWVTKVHEWCDALGLPKEAVHELEVPDEDRAHYSKRTIDFEFDFPHGRKELLGLAYRTDFDLMNIQDNSGKSMDYTVKGTNEKFVPHVIEPSFGVERALMAVLATAYTVDEVNGEKRVFLKLPTHLAPIKFAVSPLLRNKEELVTKAKEVYAQLKKQYGAVIWDDNGNIGKRYRRSDEIGVPKHITIDFKTLEDGTVTVRDRDTTEQTRVKIDEL